MLVVVLDAEVVVVTVVAVVTVVVRGGEVTVVPVVVVLVGCTMVVVLPTLTDFVVGVDELFDELLLASSTTTTTTAAMASAIPPAIAQPRPPPPRSGPYGPVPGRSPGGTGPSPGATGRSSGGGSKLSDMPQRCPASGEMHHPDRMMAPAGPLCTPVICSHGDQGSEARPRSPAARHVQRGRRPRLTKPLCAASRTGRLPAELPRGVDDADPHLALPLAPSRSESVCAPPALTEFMQCLVGRPWERTAGSITGLRPGFAVDPEASRFARRRASCNALTAHTQQTMAVTALWLSAPLPPGRS